MYPITVTNSLTTQSKIILGENIIYNAKLTDAMNGISVKSVDLIHNDVLLTIQEQTTNFQGNNANGIKTKDVTEYYKCSDAVSKILSTEKAIVPTQGKTWAKTFGGSSYDLAHSIQQITDGGYILAGETRTLVKVVMISLLLSWMQLEVFQIAVVIT